MIRARSGSEVVSAGHVHNPSSEVASGRIDEEFLRSICELTGGHYLTSTDQELELSGSTTARYVELWPWLLEILLGLFLVDLLIRRWENFRGLLEQIGGLFRRRNPA